MRHISGLIPTDQDVVRPSVSSLPSFSYRPVTRPYPRPVRKGMLAGILLFLAFCLLLWGGGVGGQGEETAAAGGMGTSLLHMPIGSVATLVGRTPAEAVQLLWDSGVRITDSGQTLQEIADDNCRKSTEILAILDLQDHSAQTMVD